MAISCSVLCKLLLMMTIISIDYVFQTFFPFQCPFCECNWKTSKYEIYCIYKIKKNMSRVALMFVVFKVYRYYIPVCVYWIISGSYMFLLNSLFGTYHVLLQVTNCYITSYKKWLSNYVRSSTKYVTLYFSHYKFN